jgi:hypothetical protein
MDPILLDGQLAVGPFLAMIREQLRRPLCFKDPVPLKSDEYGNYYLDHVEIPTATGFLDGTKVPSPGGHVQWVDKVAETQVAARSDSSPEGFLVVPVETNELHVVIPVQLHIVVGPWSAVGNPAVPALKAVVNFHLRVDGSVERKKDQFGDDLPWVPRITIKPIQIDLGALGDPLFLSAAQQAAIQTSLNKIGGIDVPLDLGPVINSIGFGAKIDFWNTGVSIDVPSSSGMYASRIGMRWEIDGPADSIDSWLAFSTSGEIAPAISPEADWTLSVPSQFVVDMAVEKFRQGLEKENNKPDDERRLDVTEWPSGSWAPYGGGVVSIECGVDLIEPGPCLNDIGVDVTANIALSISTPNKLSVYTEIDKSPNIGDVAICGILDFSQLDNISGGVAPISQLVAEIFAANYDVNFAKYVDKPFAQCSWADDTTLDCPVDLTLPEGMTADWMLGFPASAVVFGALASTQASLPAVSFKLHPKWSDYGEHKYCYGVSAVLARVVLATVPFPQRVCALDTIDDKLDQFYPFVDEHDGLADVVVQMSPGWFVPAVPGIDGQPGTPGYLDAPYDCKVLVRTSAGSALVVAPPPPPPPPPAPELTPEEKVKKAAFEEAMHIAACVKQTAWPPGLDFIFRPKWWPDPAPEGVEEKHLWRVVVTDATPGQAITILDPGGQQLVAAMASRNGLVQVSTMVAPALEGAELTVMEAEVEGHAAQASLAEPSADRKLLIEQVGLARVGTLHLQGACRDLAKGWTGTATGLVCATSEGVETFDLSHAAAPIQIAQVPVAGLEGARGLPEGLLVWGRAGSAWIFIRDGRHTWRRTRGVGPITALCRIGEYLYALSPPSLLVLDGTLSKVGAVDAHGCSSMVSARGAIVLGGRDLIRVYSRTDALQPRPVAEITADGSTGVVTAGALGGTQIFAPKRNGGSVFDFTKPDEPEGVAICATIPWFASGVFVGDAFVERLAGEPSNLALYAVTERVMLGNAGIEGEERPAGYGRGSLSGWPPRQGLASVEVVRSSPGFRRG